MSELLQQVLVGVLVIVAACSATWRLLGARTRLRLISWLLRTVPATGFPGSLLHRRLQQRLATLQPGGCENCSANAGTHKRRI